MEAASEAVVNDSLRKQQIVPSKVKAKPKKKAKKGGKISAKDITIFLRQFATMIDAGLPLVQCLDLFTLCSLSEGTSMALLEAMAGEVPVAVTDVGGNPEIVEANKTGWVIPSGDTEQLTNVILEAATNPQLANQYATAGKQRFEEKFTFGRMIGEYRRIYQAMVSC